MKINVKDKQGIVSEQKSVLDGEPEVGYICEMASEPAKLADFGFPQDVVGRANALRTANEDEKPEFPVIRVEEGWSGSGRLWDGSEVENIVRQTNELEPVGHLGHIPDDQAAFAFPSPQTAWIGAIAKKEPSKQKERLGEQVTVAYFAGYNLPGSEIRTKKYIKNKVVRGISWWGRGDQIPVPGQGVQVRNFTLQALDWARKLSEGMPTSRIVAMAKEMKGDDVAEIELAQVTPEQFKKDNPNGYALLVNEAVAEKDEKIGEMEKQIEDGKKDKDLLAKACELLGIDNPEEITAKLTDLKAKVGEKAKATLATGLDTVLAERIPGEGDDVVAKRALIKRLLPVSEMETKLESAKPEEAEKLIGEMVTTAFDSDEVIKQHIGEQQPPVVRRREELRSGSTEIDKALTGFGVERQRVTMS